MVSEELQHAGAFAFGATLGAVITCPLEVVKTRQQSSFAKFASATMQTVNHQPSRINTIISPQLNTQPLGIWQCLQSITRQEGSRALFKGLVPNLLGVIPGRSVFYFFYYSTKEALNQKFDVADSDLVHMAASAVGSFTASVTTNPIWLVKTRVQLDRTRPVTGQNFTVRQCCRVVWNESGFKGFYKGFAASQFTIAESVIQFTMYEKLKRQYWQFFETKEGKTEDLPSAWVYFCGGFSKLVASVLTYPHEVVRTRMREPGRKYRTVLTTLKIVCQEEGWPTLFRGLKTSLCRQVPNAAIMMGTYEMIAKYLPFHFHKPIDSRVEDAELEEELLRKMRAKAELRQTKTQPNFAVVVSAPAQGEKSSPPYYSSATASAASTNNDNGINGGFITISTDLNNNTVEVNAGSNAVDGGADIDQRDSHQPVKQPIEHSTLGEAIS